MEVSLATLRWFVGIAGPLVLISYVIGLLRADDPMALWGGIGASERKLIIPFMFLAATGFLTVAYLALIKWDVATLQGLHWPWGEADGNGLQRLLLAYALYLIPSALWLESTLLHIQFGAGWSQALAIGILTLVTVGLVMLLLLGWGAQQDGVQFAVLFMLGVAAMMIQSTIFDNIIWVKKFPW